jgi:ribosomal protein S12 methylthiotransferase
MGTFHILTLGCPKNKVDSENLESILSSEGFTHTHDIGNAEIVLINTCGFIQDAVRESVNEILNIIHTRTEGQKIVVFGCLTERYMEDLIKELPEIDAFFGIEKQKEIADYCKSVLQKTEPGHLNRSFNLAVEASSQAAAARDLKSITQIPTPPIHTPYAYIKIADGCNRSCSFCTIPKIKGPFRDYSPDYILERAEEHIRAGKRELILVAQDITSYGKDLGEYGLKELIDDITSIEGDFWLRLLYLYPTAIDESLLEAVSGNSKVCRYLDIPLQHSEDRILRLMKRGGSRKGYTRLVNMIRRIDPDITLRTSIIVGFPSETEVEFMNLLGFIKEVEFDRLGAFRYSKEEGTAASGIKHQIPESIKKERYHELMTLQAGISYRKNSAMIGRVVRVIVDRLDDGIALCRYEGQAPDIDGVTIVQVDEERFGIGDFIDVRITGATEYDLMGEVADRR